MTNPNAIDSTASFSTVASRSSAWALPLHLLTNWEKNNNRINHGEIEALAMDIAMNGQNSALLGFWQNGIFQVTDGARRLQAFTFISKNLDKFPGYTMPRINVKPMAKESTEFDFLASQITTETLNKSSYEKALIVEQMASSLTREGKKPTQQQIADALHISVATVSNYLTVTQNSTPEVLEKIKNGELTIYDAVETLSNKKKEVKAQAKKEKETSGTRAKVKTSKLEVKTEEFKKSKSATPKNRFLALAVETLSDTVPEYTEEAVKLTLTKEQYQTLISLMGEF